MRRVSVNKFASFLHMSWGWLFVEGEVGSGQRRRLPQLPLGFGGRTCFQLDTCQGADDHHLFYGLYGDGNQNYHDAQLIIHLFGRTLTKQRLLLLTDIRWFCYLGISLVCWQAGFELRQATLQYRGGVSDEHPQRWNFLILTPTSCWLSCTIYNNAIWLRSAYTDSGRAFAFKPDEPDLYLVGTGVNKKMFLGPRGPLALPLVDPCLRNENLDPMYTGIFASWIIRRLIKPTLYILVLPITV